MQYNVAFLVGAVFGVFFSYHFYAAFMKKQRLLALAIGATKWIMVPLIAWLTFKSFPTAMMVFVGTAFGSLAVALRRRRAL